MNNPAITREMIAAARETLGLSREMAQELSSGTAIVFTTGNSIIKTLHGALPLAHDLEAKQWKREMAREIDVLTLLTDEDFESAIDVPRLIRVEPDGMTFEQTRLEGASRLSNYSRSSAHFAHALVDFTTSFNRMIGAYRSDDYFPDALLRKSDVKRLPPVGHDPLIELHVNAYECASVMVNNMVEFPLWMTHGDMVKHNFAYDRKKDQFGIFDFGKTRFCPIEFQMSQLYYSFCHMMPDLVPRFAECLFEETSYAVNRDLFAAYVLYKAPYLKLVSQGNFAKDLARAYHDLPERPSFQIQDCVVQEHLAKAAV